MMNDNVMNVVILDAKWIPLFLYPLSLSFLSSFFLFRAFFFLINAKTPGTVNQAARRGI